MSAAKVVSYLRVSTARQGDSGLGIEAQRAAVLEYLNGGQWTLLREYVEIETGKRSDRPQLSAALAYARATGATVVIAKWDRLARNVAFTRGAHDQREWGCGLRRCGRSAYDEGAAGR